MTRASGGVHAQPLRQRTGTDEKVIMVHVSNRQKASGLAGGSALTEALVVGLALCDSTIKKVGADLEAEIEQHRAEMPPD